MRGMLTDKQITKYIEQGYYSAEFKDARRQYMENKQKKREAKRAGNFMTSEGRMIYSPV